MVKEVRDKTLDEDVEELLKEENATSKAVESLITVKDREKGKPSEVELKTDLSEDEIKVHTVLSVLNNVLEMKEEKFSERCILLDVIESKERKALSKDRKSREEIVLVARQPDLTMMDMGIGSQKEGLIKRFFSSRRNKKLPPSAQ